jgi:hypothetical protein
MRFSALGKFAGDETAASGGSIWATKTLGWRKIAERCLSTGLWWVTAVQARDTGAPKALVNR